MRTERIVLIGTSAGGIDALRTMAAALPVEFPAPICVVMHTAPESPGVLRNILERAGELPAIVVRRSERLRGGTIYVAAPDTHLIVEPGRVRATRGPRENRFRPAIDPLFRSAAQVYGPAAIGVILTGNLDDGTAGLAAIKQLGGIAIVQDPADAVYPSMPESALRHVAIDYETTLANLAPLLVQVTAQPLTDRGVTVPDLVNVEVNIAKEQPPRDAGLEEIGVPSPVARPECHGVLLQLDDAGRQRFRCHTGHAYSIDSLVADIDANLQVALWNAIRALEEAALLTDRLAVLRGPAATDAAAIQRRVVALHQQSDALRAIARDQDSLLD